MSAPAMPGHELMLRTAMSVAIVGGPLCYLIGGLLSPAIHASGPATIAANASASPVANGVHLVSFFLGSFLLPLGAAGLAWLCYRRTPWLATVGGLLGVIGWLPFSALTALDDLASSMAGQTGGSSYGALLDRFTNDAVMNAYLLIYVICHLAAYVVLGIALRRARVIPAWAAWAMVASSPITIAAFAFHDAARTAVGVAALALLIGSLPAAPATGTISQMTAARRHRGEPSLKAASTLHEESIAAPQRATLAGQWQGAGRGAGCGTGPKGLLDDGGSAAAGLRGGTPGIGPAHGSGEPRRCAGRSRSAARRRWRR